MYLIHIDTLQLEEFVGEQIPPYAILSHRWGPEELTFKDVLKNRADKNSRGYRKLSGACQVAKRYRVEYLWIDTCCIDKKSSAELSEAINSMFSWYENAEVCIAYLEEINHSNVAFMHSVWFTRAWTLQELLSPRKLDFYDYHWHEIGSRESRAVFVEAVTKIPSDVLIGEKSHEMYSIAERMSWAAGREAARTEDIAYSLMGLFGVNMPLLYGEGSKAFVRLQEEIIRNSTYDPSILSWGFGRRTKGPLATHPTEFRNPEVDLESAYRYQTMSLSTPLYLTSVGLTIVAKLYRWHEIDTYAVIVGSYLFQQRRFFRILLLIQYSNWNHVFTIGATDEDISLSGMHSETRTLTIKPGRRNSRAVGGSNGFFVLTDSTQSSISIDTQIFVSSNRLRANVHWKELDRQKVDSEKYMLCVFDTARLLGVAQFHVNIGDLTLWLCAYFDFDSRPCLCIGHAPIRVEFELLPSCNANPKPKVSPGDLRIVTTCVDRVFRDDLGQRYYFFGAPQDLIYHCQVPTDPRVWFTLEHPGAISGNEEYWTLSIDLQGPAASIRRALLDS